MIEAQTGIVDDHQCQIREPSKKQRPGFLIFLEVLFKLFSRNSEFIASVAMGSVIAFVAVSVDMETMREIKNTPNPEAVPQITGYAGLSVSVLASEKNITFGFSPDNEFSKGFASETKTVLDAVTSSNLDFRVFPNKEELAETLKEKLDNSSVAFESSVTAEETNVTIMAKGTGAIGALGSLNIFTSFASRFLNPDNSFESKNTSLRQFATPGGPHSFGSDGVVGYYVAICFVIITQNAAVLFSTLTSEKVIFWLRVNGLSPIHTSIGLFIFGLILMMPGTVLITTAVCFIAKSTRGSNFLIVLLSTLLYSVGQWLFSCTLIPLLMKKNNIGLIVMVCIMWPLLFMFLNMFRTLANIPDLIYIITSAIFPHGSYMNTFFVYSRVRWDHGPISFSTLGESYNGLSMGLLLGLQALNLVIWGITMVLAFLYVPPVYGVATMIFGKKKTENGSIGNLSSPALVLENVKKTYNGNAGEIVALDNINCRIQEKEVVVMIGPNGAGKSTFIDVLTGAFHPDSGTVSIYGQTITDDFTVLYQHLGIVFQGNTMINRISVRDNFKVIGELRGLDPELVEERMTSLTTQLELADCLGKFAGDLSGGQKRKLCLALALLHKPAILIMDEPTAGVDVQSRQMIWRVVANEEATCLITTHALEEAASVCTRLFVLARGNFAFQGTPTELRQQTHSGYILTVTQSVPDPDAVLSFLREYIPEAERKEDRDDHFTIPDDLRMAEMLEALEASKDRIGVERYTLHMSNLEEVMVQMIQEEEFAMMEHQ